MREIKFKIWADNKFYDKCLVGNTNNTNDNKWTCPMIWLEDKKEWVHCDNGIICQYTGLYDKNGVEIYEGDIVKVFVCGNYIKGYIKYNDERGRFDVGWMSELKKYKRGEKSIGSCSCMYNEYDDLEVIGNIWKD